MTDLLLHKLNKYQIKLQNNSENEVYKYKVKYYSDLIGGLNNPQNPTKKYIYNFNNELLLEPNRPEHKMITIYEYINSQTLSTRYFYSIKLSKGIKNWNDIKIIKGDIYFNIYRKECITITDITSNKSYNNFVINYHLNIPNMDIRDTFNETLNDFLINNKPLSPSYKCRYN